MPNTKPNLKSKAGNVTHPFSEKTVNAANKIYGAEHEREMPHPLKQVNPNIQKGSAAYNALDEMGMIDKLTKPAPAPVIPGIPDSIKNFKFTLPNLNLPTTNFTSGSYTNPQSTTSSDTNTDSNIINPYSFMDDELLTKEMPEHVNKFGFHKRNLPSLDARLKQALADGKYAKAKRLQKKKENFIKSQTNRAGEDFMNKFAPNDENE